MTQKTIKTFTGEQLAIIVMHSPILRNLNTKYLGAKDSLKLYKFLEKSVGLYNKMIVSAKELLEKQNNKLIEDNPEYADLLAAFAKIREDIVASNKFINEHAELEYLVPLMESNNKELMEMQQDLSSSVHEIPYTIDNTKLEKALEDKELTVEQLHNLAFLFD